jgi:hypothetical protein
VKSDINKNKKVKLVTIRGEEDKTQGYVFPRAKKKDRIEYMHKRLSFKAGSLINVNHIEKEVWSNNDNEAEIIEDIELDVARGCIMILTKSRCLMPILIGLDTPWLESYELEE